MSRPQWASLAVFVVSAVALASLEYARAGHITVYGVGEATEYAHLSPDLPWSVTVAEVLVREGQRVRAGDPLVRLSRTRLDDALREDHAEVLRIIREAQLLRARVAPSTTDASAADDAPGTRGVREPHPTAASELTALAHLRDQHQRPDALAQLRTVHEALRAAAAKVRRREDQRRALGVTALADGVVTQIARVGQRIPAGTRTATLVPEAASEVVAFVPADHLPSETLELGGQALIAMAHGQRCEARLDDATAPVRAVAEQLVPMGAPTHGWPVRLSLPNECTIGVGQAVRVTLPAR